MLPNISDRCGGREIALRAAKSHAALKAIPLPPRQRYVRQQSDQADNQGFLVGEFCISPKKVPGTFEEGRVNEKLEKARNLLVKGSTPEFVHDVTGLDMETIRNL